MELGEPDESGRRKPVPLAGTDYDILVDVVVNAVGTRANPLLTATAPDLVLNRWGNIVIDENGTTSIQGVYAGGDIVRGGATVILAMGDGKEAAAAIHKFLMTGTTSPIEDKDPATEEDWTEDGKQVTWRG
jgi:glutamate synthase (NADPH/NADH) small chain